MICEYEIKDWNKLSNKIKEVQDNFSILDDEEPIIDSNFDNFDERELTCLTKANLQML